jgi:LacI family transcriptional regulator
MPEEACPRAIISVFDVLSVTVTSSRYEIAGVMSRRGHKRATIFDVARKAGVSRMTVSRVVNGGGSVSRATRETVQNVIRDLRYMPTVAARTLGLSRVHRLDRLALLHEDPRAFALSRLLIGVIEQSSRLGIEIVPHRVHWGTTDAWRTARKLVEDRVAGAMLTPPLGDCAALVEALHAVDIPVVVIATGKAPAEAMCIGIDDHGAAYEMTQHLLALGHQRIGFIRGDPMQSASEERWRGFAAALRDAGIDSSPVHVAQGLCTYRSGLEAARRLLSSSCALTAIFASNDEMAAAVVAVADRRGLHVPRALTVVGFDDSLVACTVWPELTTIHQPVTQMATEAVKMLVRTIRFGRPASQVGCKREFVRHSLVVRASAAAPIAKA